MGVIYALGQPVLLQPQPNIFSEAWLGFLFLLLIDTKPYQLPAYLPQGWTLVEEHMGSLLLFLCCLAFARTSTRVRVVGVSIVIVYKFHLGEWVGWLFLMGMLLAELRHFRAKRPALKPIYRRMLTIGSVVMLFPTLFFGSWPFNGTVSECVGFRHFVYISQGSAIEPVRFFLGWAGVAFVLILENLPCLQALFNTSVVLYLGDISYSLYLVHWMVSQGWSKHLSLRMILAGYTKLSACLTSLVLTFILGVWVADLLWRLGDAQSVRFARWAAKRLGI
jgi:peptidoglycan/LPS O-acetylase OafA/YrhL